MDKSYQQFSRKMYHHKPIFSRKDIIKTKIGRAYFAYTLFALEHKTINECKAELEKPEYKYNQWLREVHHERVQRENKEGIKPTSTQIYLSLAECLMIPAIQALDGMIGYCPDISNTTQEQQKLSKP